MNIASIINHEYDQMSTPCTGTANDPGLFCSTPITPKNHWYNTTSTTPPRRPVVVVEGPTSPDTPAQSRFQLAKRRKRKVHESDNHDYDDEHNQEGLCPVPMPLVSQMPLKKRPLRTHESHKTTKVLRCLALAAHPPADMYPMPPPSSSSSSDRSFVTIHLLNNRKGLKRVLGGTSRTVTGTPRLPISTSSSSSLSKKAITDAAVTYDSMDIDIPETDVFSPDWTPSLDIFNGKSPPPSVRWKGTPLDISHFPYYDRLHLSEVAIASTLRLVPEQYIRCKRVLVLAAQAAQKKKLPFRKSEAQKLCRIDVNKVSVLWGVFGKLGWLGSCWPGEKRHRHRH